MSIIVKNLVGCDIVEISRVKKILGDESLVKKIFHPSEMKTYDPEHLAGIFALKEAVMKALGLKSNSWLDIEIRHTSAGKPNLILSKDLNLEITSLDCSVSHDGGFAFAVVIALKEK